MIKVFYSNVKVLEEEKIFHQCLDYVGERVSSKVNKIVKINSKCRTLGGWALLKYILEKFNIDYLYENIKYNEFGKPFFESNDYYFNISHSGDYCVCVISSNEVGCDIEEIRSKMPKIYNNLFHSHELDFINNLNEYEKIDKFINLWSRKESFIKCIGTGFSKETKEFSLINSSANDFYSYLTYENTKIYINNILVKNYYITVGNFNEAWDKSIEKVCFLQIL